jgi:hypothetical protein
MKMKKIILFLTLILGVLTVIIFSLNLCSAELRSKTITIDPNNFVSTSSQGQLYFTTPTVSVSGAGNIATLVIRNTPYGYSQKIDCYIGASDAQQKSEDNGDVYYFRYYWQTRNPQTNEWSAWEKAPEIGSLYDASRFQGVNPIIKFLAGSWLLNKGNQIYMSLNGRYVGNMITYSYNPQEMGVDGVRVKCSFGILPGQFVGVDFSKNDKAFTDLGYSDTLEFLWEQKTQTPAATTKVPVAPTAQTSKQSSSSNKNQNSDNQDFQQVHDAIKYGTGVAP